MSISAAVAELNKEIASLDRAITETQKAKSRVIAHRDALLKEDQTSGSRISVTKGKPGRKPGRPAKKAVSVKKTAVANKSVSAKKAVVPKKRTVSPEGKKRIAEAQKKRWADQKANAKTA